jgi:hypothetical protein
MTESTGTNTSRSIQNAFRHAEHDLPVHLRLNVTLEQQLASSFNGKPKAPAWTASNDDDVLGMESGECHAV